MPCGRVCSERIPFHHVTTVAVNPSFVSSSVRIERQSLVSKIEFAAFKIHHAILIFLHDIFTCGRPESDVRTPRQTKYHSLTNWQPEGDVLGWSETLLAKFKGARDYPLRLNGWSKFHILSVFFSTQQQRSHDRSDCWRKHS